MRELDFLISNREEIYNHLNLWFAPVKRTHNGRQVDIFFIKQKAITAKEGNKLIWSQFVNELQLNYDPLNHNWTVRVHIFPLAMYNLWVEESDEQDYEQAIGAISLDRTNWIFIYEHKHEEPHDFAIKLIQHIPGQDFATQLTFFQNGFWTIGQVSIRALDAARRSHKDW